MRTSALALGILAGVSGLLVSVFVLGADRLATAFKAGGPESLSLVALAAIACCHAGLLGAGLSMRQPWTGGLLMILAAVVFAAVVGALAIITTPIFIIAGALGMMAGQETESAMEVD